MLNFYSRFKQLLLIDCREALFDCSQLRSLPVNAEYRKV